MILIDTDYSWKRMNTELDDGLLKKEMDKAQKFSMVYGTMIQKL